MSYKTQLRVVRLRRTWSYSIRTTQATLSQRLSTTRTTRSVKKFANKHLLRSKKRTIRYSIIAANIAILAVVGLLIVKNPSSSQAVSQNVASTTESNGLVSPLDQLSSADIAVNAASMAGLPEAVSTANLADSVKVQLSIAPADIQVVARPQVVNTDSKSIKDITSYLAQPGDTVSSLARKFGVTSDSIRWSNNLTGENIIPGSKLWISPISNGFLYVVQGGDTAASLANKFHTTKEKIVSINDAEFGGIHAGQRIIVPGGSISTPTATFANYGGFSWGSTAIYGSNGYDFGWCTWYAANRRNQLGHPVPSNLGNAYSWYQGALSAGLPTGDIPKVGAVMVYIGGNHVSVVEKVNSDGSFWVSEMNAGGQVSITNTARAGGWGQVDYKLYPSAQGNKFIY